MSVTYRRIGGEVAEGMDQLKELQAGPIFSDAVRVEVGTGALISISGKIGRGAIDSPPASIGVQTEQIFEDLAATLAVEGGTLDDLVRLRVYVTDISDDAVLATHEVRARLFTPGRYPASTLVQVSGFVLPGAYIEIDADAFIPAGRDS